MKFNELFKNEYGIAILWTAKGTKDVRDFAESTKFSFKDTNMLHIHANMTQINSRYSSIDVF